MFNYIQRHKPHLIFSQEIHLVGSKGMALKRAFVAHTLHSTYSNYARGVTILIAKSLFCSITTNVTDPFGRYVMAILGINNCLYTFVAFYVPPPFTITFWDTVMAQVPQVAEGPLIVAGDINAVLSPVLDRFQYASLCTSPLAICASKYNLEDCLAL